MLASQERRAIYQAATGFALLILCTACNKELPENCKDQTEIKSVARVGIQANKQNTFYGPQVQMGDGKARSFITLTHSGVPIELGLEMTKGAFSGLPETHALSAFTLPLHQKAQAATAFDHIVINWNAHGHPPFVLFREPHFDFHFYTISVSEQQAIPAYTPGSPHDLLPAAPFRPAGFVPTPGGEAGMGKHWVDLLHPVTPGNFTHTMIYGSYNGKIHFTEPMITRAFLQTGQDVTMAYGQPAQFAETGTYYPSVYNIRDDETKHYITLSNFALK